MESLKGPLVTLLCLSLCFPAAPSFGQEPSPPAGKPAGHTAARPAYQSGQIHGDQRILHALNRFTFGARPGDLEAVRTMGLEQWFDQQLHPERIDLSALRVKLAQYPAMEWSPQNLLFRLPSNGLIRQAADSKIEIPESPALHSVYLNQIARMREREQEHKDKQTLAASAKPAMATPSPTAETPAVIEPKAPDLHPPMDDAGVQRILALPPNARVARLVSLKQPDFDSFRKALKGPQRAALYAGLSPDAREVLAALDNPQRLVVDELAEQRLTHDIYSNAQLQEVMADFWLNHFNVFLHKNDETPYYLASYERDVIRPLAMGKFEDLLEATAHNPAMLIYLDNSSSIGPDSPNAEHARQAAQRHPDGKPKAVEGLNENYARELMELHTLGVNGGYTQADVTQVARVFTGWTVDKPQRGGGFKFDENRHQPGSKKVLGKKIKERGELEGVEVLHMLAASPATAHFLSRKLAIRFVSDDPPQSLIDRMARTYLSSGGDISAVLGTLFHSPEFWSADAYRAKVKTPLEFVVSAVRAGALDPADLMPLVNALRDMGMPLYGAVPPTGYNWQSSTWVSTGALVNRMNFALSLASGKLSGISTPWTANLDATGGQSSLVSTAAPGPESEEKRLEAVLVAGGISVSTRAAVLKQLETQSSTATRPSPAQAASSLERQDQLLAGLLLGSPEFQRR